MDKLEAHLKPIYDRFQNSQLQGREDARLSFTADIRRVIKSSGYKSNEEVWDMVMGAKKSGFEDGVAWEQHRKFLELTKQEG